MGHCRRHLHSNSQSPYRNLAFLHVFSSALFLLPFRSLQYRPRLTRETRITSKHWHTLLWLTFLPLQALIAVSFANFCVQAAFWLYCCVALGPSPQNIWGRVCRLDRCRHIRVGPRIIARVGGHRRARLAAARYVPRTTSSSAPLLMSVFAAPISAPTDLCLTSLCVKWKLLPPCVRN
jgi:hypothetical protein